MQAATVPANVVEAFAMLHSSLDHLTGADWRALGSAVQAGALRELSAAQAKLTVARSEALGAFDAGGGHSLDGHPSAQSWLRHQARLTGKDARDACGWERTLRTHPVLREALATGDLSQSWARQFAAWTDRLPEAEREQADQILLDAARAGLPLHPDIARLAQAIYEAVRSQQPDADPDDGGFCDRGLRMGTTLDGAGRLRGDLSARCAELMAKALEAFGKPVGHDDLRTQAQRNHDALETALGLSLGVPDVPQSGGMKTQALVTISLADLIAMDEGSVLVDKWLTVRTAEAGWLSGDDAGAAACAAHITPVVTGAPDWDVVSDMADVFLDAHGISHGLSREARLALERTLLAMAVQALSGPDGLAGFLRANLLGRPFSGASLPLDLGDSDHIPDYLRRAVIVRDRKCQWPGGCDRPASHCEPHHLRPRSEGGETSLANLRLYCFAHHHIYIHRVGWKVTVHADGSSTATSPHGKVIHSHTPGQPRPPGTGPPGGG
ncbi:MAG TPA: DUF222 domain-containing protein [Trebonia sp.]|nr:DUF222 domain-containing protein [Trebonia sp.]